MSGTNRDTIAAIFVMVMTAVAFWATFDIQVRDDGIMQATEWPRAIIILLAVLGVIYFLQSTGVIAGGEASTGETERRGIVGFLKFYANPIWCLGLYFVFLATLPWLGMLIGGTLLVFMMLNVLGGMTPRKLVLHATIAVVSIGLMWAIFTFALRVALPDGELLPLILPR